MAGNPSRGRRITQPDSVRDRIQQRGAAHASPATRAVVGGRPPRAESNHDLLNQLPVALGGNRAPGPADGGPGARGRGGGGRGHALVATIGAEDLFQLPGVYRQPTSADVTPGGRARGSGSRGPVQTAARGADGASNRAPSSEGKRHRSQPPPWVPQEQSPETKDPGKMRRGEARSSSSRLPDVPRAQGARSDGPASRGRARDPPPSGRAASLLSKAAEPNSQFRPYMEDRYVSIDPFMAGECSSEQWGFFAVYDGHGGSLAADHCASELHKVLQAELRGILRDGQGHVSQEAVADALTRTFQKVDDQLRTAGAWQQGCTATVALLRRSIAGLTLHVANVGDSRAVAVDGKNSCRLSQDHRPTDTSEARRVQQAGGFVAMGRVAGELAVSRALGDHALKGKGVSWRPHVCTRDATRDVALVIASDGLWDALSDEDARAMIDQSMQHGDGEQVAHRLVEDAQRRGSMDNIACLTVFL